MKKKDVLLAVEINTVWGAVYALTKYISPIFPSISLFAVRFFFGGLVGLAINFKILTRVKISMRQCGILVAFSTAFSLSCYFVAVALPKLDSSVVNILERGETIITMILGIIFFREKLSARAILGIFICFFALYLISAGGEGGNLFSLFVIFLSCVSGAISNILSKKIDIGNKSKATLGFLISGIELLILSRLSGEKILLSNLDYRAALSIAFLVIFSSYFCYLELYYLLEKYDVGAVMPFRFIVPVVSIVTGFVLLGEAITAKKIVSLILIIAGITLTQYSVKKNEKK
ncbi:MAG: DMT family transporter [Rickettsiales bacterium]|nr:DMT family transporter [Rickettsiales bacterium]